MRNENMQLVKDYNECKVTYRLFGFIFIGITREYAKLKRNAKYKQLKPKGPNRSLNYLVNPIRATYL